jgi:hypothetical protein
VTEWGVRHPDGAAQASGRLKASPRPRVGRVHVPPEDNNGNTARAGQLEGNGHRLGATARDPGVVYNKDVGTGDRITDAHPGWVNASRVDLLRHDRQPHQGQVHA